MNDTRMDVDAPDLTEASWNLVLEWLQHQQRHGIDSLDALRWLVLHFYLVAVD